MPRPGTMVTVRLGYGKALQLQLQRKTRRKSSWTWLSPLTIALQPQRGYRLPCCRQFNLDTKPSSFPCALHRNHLFYCPPACVGAHKFRRQSTSSRSKISCNPREDNDSSLKRIRYGNIPYGGKGIQVGQFSEFHRSFSQEDVNEFGTLIGDLNPVHYPADSNNPHQQVEKQRLSYEKPIVHGILLSSVFSTIFGTIVPGCIYRSQSLHFRNPVYVGEQICGRVTVKKLREIDRQGDRGVLCVCDTTVTKSDASKKIVNNDSDEEGMFIRGEAHVWLPGATVAE